jgi:hypothetical protein
MACDDNGYLFLSTDSNPANKKKIAAQPQWSDQNQWNDPDTTEVRSDQYTASEWPTPNVITLTAGQKYYIELDFQEGGGGDGSEGFYKLAADADPANGTAPDTRGAVIGTYADPSTASITITQQPQNATVLENSSATFTVAATGSVATLFYQWQKAPAAGAFTDIAGANSASYTTPALPASENGSRYRAAISVPGLTTNSAEATVAVTVDNVLPTLSSALRSFSPDTQVLVVFSELMQAASANVAGNYTINNGITVSAAALQADGKTVLLTTSPIAKGTSNTLTVSGVRDLAGNQIAAASQIAIGFQRGALFVIGGTAPATPNVSDGLIKSRLESRGYFVELVSSDVDDVSMATGKDIVVLSSTFGSGTVIDTYKNVTVPVLDWEQAIQDDMAMTTVGGSTDRGTTTGLSTIEIVDPAHPMAAGFPAGPMTPVTAPSEFAWGQPNANAQVVARLVGTANACIYGYDKGALLTDGTPAAERRVLFLMTDNVAANFNADGFKLFDAAIDWAQNIAVAVQPRFNAPTISAGNVTISWTGTGTLQEATNLTGNPSDWTNVTGNPPSPFSVPISSAARKFYRVRSP